MAQALRSLSGLIDFDCAARWGGFKLAAAELHKTPAAISQQIKQLESELGFALFVRHPRHIVLTEKGRDLAVTVARTLADLRAKVAALQGGDEESILRISTTHSFAIKWLVPRMARFTRLYPELDIRLDSADRLIDLEDDANDVAIRYGSATAGGPNLLFRERLVAVYSPELLPAGHGDLTMADLHRYPLLSETSNETWLQMLRENRATKAHYHFSRGYTHWGVLAQAAVAGQGVALVPYGIVYQDILNGTLKQLDCRSAPFDMGYRLLINQRKAGMAKIERFRTWLEGEMTLMQQSLDQRGACELE